MGLIVKRTNGGAGGVGKEVKKDFLVDVVLCLLGWVGGIARYGFIVYMLVVLLGGDYEYGENFKLVFEGEEVFWLISIDCLI